MTIDGFPNGTSEYRSGSKANRFIDPLNLGGVEFSPRASDVISRSVEVQGGTFNFSDGRSGGRAGLHRVEHRRRERRSVVLHAGRHGTVFRRRDGCLDRCGLVGGDRLGAGLGKERTGARRRQARLVAGVPRIHRLHLLRCLPRVYKPAALQGGRLQVRPALGPAGRRLARRSYLNQGYWPDWQTRRSHALTYVRADWSFSEFSSLSAGTYYHHDRGRGAGCPPISFFSLQARTRRRPADETR